MAQGDDFVNCGCNDFVLMFCLCSIKFVIYLLFVSVIIPCDI